MQEFKVIIAGSRSFNNYALLAKACDKILSEKRKTHKIVVLCGEAKGADTLGKVYAHKQGFSVASFPANWTKHGKSAGHIRNAEMRDAGADALIAFWNGKSPGTENMIQLMQKAGKPVQVIRYDELPETNISKPADHWYKDFAKGIPEEIIEQILLAEDLPNDPFSQECFRAGFVHAMEVLVSISNDKTKDLPAD